MQASDVQCLRCWSHVCPLLSCNEIFQWVVCVSERIYKERYVCVYTCRCMVKCRLCRIHWVPLIRVKVKGSHRKSSAVHLTSWWPALTIFEHVGVTYPQYKCSRMLIGISFPHFASWIPVSFFDFLSSPSFYLQSRSRDMSQVIASYSQRYWFTTFSFSTTSLNDTPRCSQNYKIRSYTIYDRT